MGQPKQICVRPFALGPRFDELEVFGEVDRLQLVVHELADVPWKIVVSETKKKMTTLKISSLIQSLFRHGGLDS